MLNWGCQTAVAERSLRELEFNDLNIHRYIKLWNSFRTLARSAENDRIGADTDPVYQIDASLIMTWPIRADRKWNGTEIGGGIGKGPWATIQTRDALSATQGYRRQHNDKKKKNLLRNSNSDFIQNILNFIFASGLVHFHY